MLLKNVTSKLIEDLRTTIVAQGLDGRKDITNSVLTLESMDDVSRASVTSAITSLEDAVTGTINMLVANADAGVNVSAAQRAAAVSIAKLAIDPSAGVRAIQNANSPWGKDAHVISAGEMGVGDTTELSEYTTESFDAQSTNNALYFSIAYNLLGPKQDSFAETFFGMIAADPTMSGINVTTDVVSLYSNFSRTTDGAANRGRFNKIALAKAVYDNNVFGADRNAVVPVLRTGANSNAANFVTGVQFSDTTTGVAITSAPLVVGKTIGLLGLSQTDAQLAKGTMDAYDALDRTMNLKSVILTLTQPVPAGAAAGTLPVVEHIRVPVGMLPYSNFTYTPQGHDKDLQLTFDTVQVALSTSGTNTTAGTPSTILGGLPTAHTIKLHLKLTGDANTQYGDVAVYANVLEVDSVLDAGGVALVPTSAVAQSAVAVITASAIDGYELEAYTTNSNLRKDGQLCTIDRYQQGYSIPVRSGMSVVVPVNATDGDDSALIGQIQLTGFRMSIDAVKTLRRYTDDLGVMTANGTVAQIEVMGIGRYHVDGYFVDRTLDLPTIVDSESSGDRLEDIRASLVEHVRTEVTKAYITSNYVVAHKLLHGDTDKIGVIIGTSPLVASYLVDGDSTIDLGNGFIAKVVTTPNTLISDSMYITFSNHFAPSDGKTIDPISFGNCAWAPGITTDVAATVDGAIVRKFQSMSRYVHFVNLPIMIRLNVTGIAAVLGKVALNTHVV